MFKLFSSVSTVLVVAQFAQAQDYFPLGEYVHINVRRLGFHGLLHSGLLAGVSKTEERA